MSRRVLFINLPSLPLIQLKTDITEKYKRNVSLSLPMGVLYLSSYLKKYALSQTRLLDYALEFDNNTLFNSFESVIDNGLEKHSDYSPEIIAISLNFSTSYKFFSTVLPLIREKWKDSLIVVGGIHASNSVEYIFRNDTKLDCIIKGEGEISLAELVIAYPQKCRIQGVYYTSDEIKDRTEDSEKVEDLDAIPFPDWDILEDSVKYFSAGRVRHLSNKVKRTSTIVTTRGCPNKCTFCSSFTVHGRKMRFRSNDNIISELRELRKRYKINCLIPEDDLFTVNEGRFLDLIGKLKALGWDDLEFETPNGLSVNAMSPAIIDALKDCGTMVYNFAIESGSEYVQKHIMKKNANLKKALMLVEYTRSIGAIARSYFIMGFPDESREMIDESFEYMKRLHADWYVLGTVMPLVGTELYERLQDDGVINENNEEEIWGNTYFQNTNLSLNFDVREYINSIIVEMNYRLNFLENINLIEGKYERYLDLMNDILFSYPFHVFALFGKYNVYFALQNIERAKDIKEVLQRVVAEDSRAMNMYNNYKYLSDELVNLIEGV